MRILTRTKENAKLSKSLGTEYEIISLFLHPSVTLCPYASRHCLAACLNTSGLAGVFPKILEARKKKSKMFLETPERFYGLVISDIISATKKAKKENKILAFRPNGTSDVREFSQFASMFPELRVYDYTKDIEKIRDYASGKLPRNYHLTFSYSGENEAESKEALALGVNVAVVFSSDKFPETFWGFPVINGDNSDLRFLDPSPCIVGLKAKGKAKKKQSSFVIPVESLKTK